jgi:hypothetical protein
MPPEFHLKEKICVGWESAGGSPIRDGLRPFPSGKTRSRRSPAHGGDHVVNGR